MNYPEIPKPAIDEMNLAYLAIDRHAASSLRDKVALMWEGKDGGTESYTLGELSTLTNKFANVLAGLGAPREIEFIDSLPRTRSGKIMRRLLKTKELGLPPGDTSTLEEY